MYCGQPCQNRTSHHAESCQLCLHHSPSSTGQRAHPKNRQVPSQTIGVHLQSSQTSCFTRFCTPFTPAAPDPTRRAIPWAGFFFLIRLRSPLGVEPFFTSLKIPHVRVYGRRKAEVAATSTTRTFEVRLCISTRLDSVLAQPAASPHGDFVSTTPLAAHRFYSFFPFLFYVPCASLTRHSSTFLLLSSRLS
jgi:hypothetical protein